MPLINALSMLRMISRHALRGASAAAALLIAATGSTRAGDHPPTPFPYTIALHLSSDFDGCYIPGVIRAIEQFTTTAAARINANGGAAGAPVKIRIFDDKDDAAKTVANMKEALTDPQLLAMIGVPSSTRGKAVFDQFGGQIGSSGVPFITEVSLNGMFADHRNVFTMASAVDNELEVIKTFLANGGFKRPAFVGVSTNLYTNAVGDGLRTLPQGATLVADHRVAIKNYKLEPEQTGPLVAELKAAAPDIIFLALGSGAGATALNAIDAAGINAPVFITLGRITRLLGATSPLNQQRAIYQLAWDGVPNAYNERLRRRIWEAPSRNWIFDDVADKTSEADWTARGCKSRRTPQLTVMHDKNRRAIGRGAQYRDMLTMVTNAANTAPAGSTLPQLRAHLVKEIAAHAQGRRVMRGWWHDWSFTNARASAADTLIITKPPGNPGIVLAPVQFVRVNNRLEPRPVVYISLDLISISRIDTNDKSFDAEFYLSFKSARKDIDIGSIDFTNAYRAQTGKDKLLSWRQIHAGAESSNFPKDVNLYRVSGKFTFEPDLGRYPFDTQRLSVSFQPSSAARPFLIQPPVAQKAAAAFALDGWQAGDSYVGADQDIIPTIDRHVGEKRIVPFYKFNYTWVVSRKATDYYLRVVVPLGFILLVTYFSVFLSHRRFESIMAIQVTALLSAIALYLALPKVDSDQATLSDRIFMITYAMVSLMVGLSVLKDMRWVRRRTMLRGSVSLLQIIGYPLAATTMIGYLVFGNPLAAGWTAKLVAALRGIFG